MTNGYYQSQRRKDETALYILGRIEQFIEDYAKSSQIPTLELTQRVAELLQLQAGGQVLRPVDQVSALRRTPALNGAAVAEMAVAGGARRRTQVKSGLHWTQLPENRGKMQKIVEAMQQGMGRKKYTQSQKALTAQRRNAALARAARWPKKVKGTKVTA